MARILLLGLLLAVSLLPRGPFASGQVLEARQRWRAGEASVARDLADAAVARLARQVKRWPGDAYRRMALAEALALRGDSRQALAEARAALAAHPAPVHSPRGDGRGSLLETAAIVAMEAGQPEDALDLLEILLARGSPASAAALAADDRFAPLRADPRWRRVVEQYAPPARPGDRQATSGGAAGARLR